MQQTSRKVTAPMCEEEKIFAGKLFAPGDEALRSIKLKAHKLSADYSRLYEDEDEAREAILRELVGSMGEDVFIQGPVFFHYGSHTSIGSHVFINYNFTVQDDARVTIGDHEKKMLDLHDFKLCNIVFLAEIKKLLQGFEG